MQCGDAPLNEFGTFVDSTDPNTPTFFFTRRTEEVDRFLRPAVVLAKRQGLDATFDRWTHGALEAAEETDDLLSKRLLWLALLTVLPDIEAWFVQSGPPCAAAFTAHVKREMHSFCLGLTLDAYGTEAALGVTEARPMKKKAGLKEEAGRGGGAVYASAADFVAQMTAYYLASL